MFQFTSTL